VVLAVVSLAALAALLEISVTVGALGNDLRCGAWGIAAGHERVEDALVNRAQGSVLFVAAVALA
jgi:hypothetical protein